MPQLCKQVFDVEGSSCADYKPQEIILGSRQCGVCVLVGSKLRGRKKGWGKKKGEGNPACNPIYKVSEAMAPQSHCSWLLLL